MSGTAVTPRDRAAELRAAFDRGFAVAVRAEDQVRHSLIAIRIGDQPFAFRLKDVAGLFADRKIIRVPGGHPAQLGIAGFRGALLPVFSLPVLFGCPAASAPRWLVVAAGEPVVLAFDAFENHLQVSSGAILPRRASSPRHSVAPEFIRTGEVVRPLIHLTSVIDALGATEALPQE